MPSYASYRRDRKRAKRRENLALLLQALRVLGSGLGQYQRAQLAERDLEQDERAEERRQKSANILDEYRQERIKTEQARRAGTLPDTSKLNPKALGMVENELRQMLLSGNPLPKDYDALIRSLQGQDQQRGDDILGLSPGAQVLESQRRGAEQGYLYELQGDPRYEPKIEQILQEFLQQHPPGLEGEQRIIEKQGRHPFSVTEENLEKGTSMFMVEPHRAGGFGGSGQVRPVNEVIEEARQEARSLGLDEEQTKKLVERRVSEKYWDVLGQVDQLTSPERFATQGRGAGASMFTPSPQGDMETPQDRSMLAEFGALYRAAMNPSDPSNTLAMARLNRLFNVPLPADIQAQSQGLGGPIA